MRCWDNERVCDIDGVIEEVGDAAETEKSGALVDACDHLKLTHLVCTCPQRAQILTTGSTLGRQQSRRTQNLSGFPRRDLYGAHKATTEGTHNKYTLIRHRHPIILTREPKQFWATTPESAEVPPLETAV